MKITHENIIEESLKSPWVEDKDQLQAFYAVGCTWWTSFPEDLGSTGPFDMEVVGADGKKEKRKAPGLPCCPFCGSVLMQAPLQGFIDTAANNPDHYGAGGLDTFYRTHHRNTTKCFNKFDNVPIGEGKK